MVESEDPTVVRSIAVTAEDVVTALEASRRSDRNTVLRITPPFSGRMRARLHEADVDFATGDEDSTAPIHVDPDSLVAADAPAYPDPADTEDEIRSSPDVEYSRERHRERHAAAVATWRESLPEAIVDTVTLETDAGPHDVEVTVLG
jgi:hypothetical protein